MSYEYEEAPARHRSFKAKSSRVEPVTFDLTTVAGKVYEFECVPEAPGAVLTDFLGAAGSNHLGRSSDSLVAFLKAVIIDADVGRFDAVIHSKDDLVDIDTLGEIVSWLVEEYGGRPKALPSRSGRGPTRTPRMSTGDSPSPDSRPSMTSASAEG